jgi:hypothetical protein
VGGTVGSVLTLAGRYASMPAEVRHHDREIAEIERDLDRFAADEYARLRNVLLPQLLGPSIERFSMQSQRAPNAKLRDHVAMVSWSMQLYRDHENAQLGRYQDIRASETWAHWLYRSLRRKPIPALETPKRAAAFLDRWPTLRVSSSEKPHMPDPRRRSIAQAMADLDTQAAEMSEDASRQGIGQQRAAESPLANRGRSPTSPEAQ